MRSQRFLTFIKFNHQVQQSCDRDRYQKMALKKHEYRQYSARNPGSFDRGPFHRDHFLTLGTTSKK